MSRNDHSHPRFTNVLFTSVSPFVNSSSLFPTHDRRIGIVVTCGYHPEEKCVMVLLEEEQPSFISTSVGEYFEPEKVEIITRQKCSELAETCRKQAKELMEHANRLQTLATQKQPLIDISRIDKDSDHEIVVLVRQEKPEKYRQAHQTCSPPVARAPRATSSLDMDDI